MDEKLCSVDGESVCREGGCCSSCHIGTGGGVKCEWSLQDTNRPDDGSYTTDCLNNFQFNEGLVGYNGFLFCPFCGRKIEQ